MEKKLFRTILQGGCWAAFTLLLVGLLPLLFSCSDNDDGNGGGTNGNVPTLTCKIKSYNNIVSYNEFGAAMLNFTAADMAKAGFTLGDVISITIGKKKIVMPYYDGFYGRNGEYMCVAYPTYPTICFTANNIGLPEDLMGLEGQSVTIRLEQKAGKIDVQEALSMTYENIRDMYPSDEAYANARAVRAGKIANGVLHRTSSPFSNEIERANYVSEYLEKQQVKSVLNLADTKEKMDNYDMPAYSRTLWGSGNVILCPLNANPADTKYNKLLIEALKELPSHPAPYVVHCMEGKDRTGYVCALLEGLCGATYEEMVDDYLTTYYNYFRFTYDEKPEVCNALVSLRLNTYLMYYADVDDEKQLPYVDYSTAFYNYLLSQGMSQQQIDALIHVLTTSK